MTDKAVASAPPALLRIKFIRKMRIAAAKFIRRQDERLVSPRNWAIAVALLAILQISLIFKHEPWLDEYQALQLAVQAPDIPTLFHWLRYEGHPPLYYLILRGLAHVMDPLLTLPVTALFFAVLMQWAILFKSPFSRAERLLIATSEFVLFEFLTLSRSMTVGTTMFVLGLVFFRRRAVWLFIAVLPFCDFLYGVLSGVLVVLLWKDKRLWWPGVGLWLVCGLAAAWTIRPMPDTIPALIHLGFVSDLTHWTTAVSTMLVPMQGGFFPAWNAPPKPFENVFWLVFLLFAWFQTRKDPFHRLILFGFIGLTFCFSMWVYPLAIRHLMLIALLLIGLTWLRRHRGERPGNGFRLWILAASICGLLTATINFVRPFDTAAQAYAMIEELGLKDKHWMVFPDSRAQGVAALSGMTFERTERQCMQDFIRWDFQTQLLEPGKLEEFVEDEIALHGKFYMLSDYPVIPILIPDEEVARNPELAAINDEIREHPLWPFMVEIGHVEPGYNGQHFYLYEVGPDAPEKPVNLPRCVPDARPLEKF